MSRVSIKPNASSQYKHHFSPSSYLSLDFGEFGVTRVIEGQIGEHYEGIKSDGHVRLQPQIFPAYGKLYFNQASFFVPASQLYFNFVSFRDNDSVSKGVKVMSPTINSLYINKFFINSSNAYSPFTFSTLISSYSDPTTPAALADADKSDFGWVIDDNGVVKYCFYKLTTIGRRYYKLLKSLGFDFVQFEYDPSAANSTVIKNRSSFHPNIYPLLAYAKVFVDMFLNGNMYNSSLLSALLDSIRFSKSFTVGGQTLYDFGSNSSELTVYGLGYILDAIVVPHKSNMYTDAYNSMVSPLGVIGADESLSKLPNLPNSSGLVSPLANPNNALADNTPNFATDYVGTSTSNFLTDFGLRTLRFVADFVYRRNLVGSKSVDRLFAMFGVEPADRGFNFVKKLAEKSTRINFHPVLSNSDTYNSQTEQGKVVGAYSGFAAEGLELHYDYKLREYGYIIQISYLTIDPVLLHGYDPQVLRQYPLDFFTPGYDGETVRAIPSCEVCLSKTFTDGVLNRRTKDVFGFVNSYDDYRQMRDIVAGDFVTGGAQNFLFSRDLSKIQSALKPQTDGVHYFSKYDNPDLSNPFYTSQSNGDRFYLELDFDIELTSPIKSKDDSLKIPSGNTVVAVGGNLMD